MPKLQVTKQHSVPLDEAKVKVRELVEDFARDYSHVVKSVDWSADGTSAKAKGKGFDGDFVVDAQKVTVNVDLSFVLSPIKGKVESRLNERLNKAFG